MQTSSFIRALDEAQEETQNKWELLKKERDEGRTVSFWRSSEKNYNLAMQFYEIVRERLVSVVPTDTQESYPSNETVKDWKLFLKLFYYE